MNDKQFLHSKYLKTCEICGEVYSSKKYRYCPCCGKIHFENVKNVRIIDKLTEYDTVEDFDCDFLATNFLSDLDDFDHYEGEWVKKQVPKYTLYIFEITYKSGKTGKKIFEEGLPVCNRLIMLSHFKKPKTK